MSPPCRQPGLASANDCAAPSFAEKNLVPAALPKNVRSTLRPMSDSLHHDIKALIIKTLKLKGVSPADIDDAAPMIGGGLELDSLDALEVVVSIERAYGIKIDTSEDSKKALQSVNSLAAFIREKKPAAAGV